MIKLIRTYFSVRSKLAPKATGRRSFKVFQKVRIKKIRDREKAFFDHAEKFTVPFEKEDIDCFAFGNPSGPLVLLVHGWESNAGSMSQFMHRFVELGYRVVAFNLPGHGQHNSSSTNLYECYHAMKNVLDHLNPTAPISVVSHSLGSAVTANALSRSNYEVDRLVFLTSPRRMEDIFMEFKNIISLGDKAYASLLKTTEKLLGDSISSLDVDANLNRIGYNDLLLIHDKTDKVLPYVNSEIIHNKTTNSSIFPLERVGHYKMLWSDTVVDQAVSFIAERESVAS
ncbi:MAG: alpha/beta hydrolase [Flavobacteriales bacterium]|nr:alpha/beta hydrolase [Flavobacteriales bacterium]